MYVCIYIYIYILMFWSGASGFLEPDRLNGLKLRQQRPSKRHLDAYLAFKLASKRHLDSILTSNMASKRLLDSTWPSKLAS